ncbi:MAG: hypothetical protein KZQ62_04460 [Candidatus Thiodiazotropha sp. (ex Lucinoma aequizonata)]|nr:hypothetical protein [Candidatus Thiodiazotropha sp. (ex Lucinoma aequizonata)]MCU7897734.1 hypothetical protein [Candidatus Thiodiazotropha sp. (ex Lucinoma aequizonata)]
MQKLREIFSQAGIASQQNITVTTLFQPLENVQVIHGFQQFLFIDPLPQIHLV